MLLNYRLKPNIFISSYQIMSFKTPISSTRLKSKRPDNEFKLINENKKSQNDPFFQNLADITLFKDLNLKLNNNTSSTTTHSSNNYQKKPNYSHSPMNFNDKLKPNKTVEKEPKKQSKYADGLLEEDMIELIKSQEKTIKTLKNNEKKLLERLEFLEKQMKYKGVNSPTGYFFDKSIVKNNKKTMLDEEIQVFIENEHDLYDDFTKSLLFYIEILQKKLEDIEENIAIKLKKNEKTNDFYIKNVKFDENLDKTLKNPSNLLENTYKGIFLRNRELEFRLQEVISEREIFKNQINYNKCSKCLNEEEEHFQLKNPIPSFIKLCKMAQDRRTCKK